MHDVDIGDLTVSNDRPLLVIAGPCQLESTDHALMIAGRMADICTAAGAQFVFKGSYDKANRTSVSGKRGLGMNAGLKVMQAVKDSIGCPVLTDVHAPDQCATVAATCDILQIPAFLCRQSRKHWKHAHSTDRARGLLWLQYAGSRHAIPADDGQNRLSGGDGCNPFGAATRGPWWSIRRAARVCPSDGTRGGVIGHRSRVYRNA